MLKGAVIGCGPGGRIHLAAWRKVCTASIEAVADRDSGRLSAAARDYYVPRRYRDLDELLSREKLDFVDIAVGVDGQAPLVRKCLTAGLHVLVSSPPVTDLDGARELADLAAGRKRVLMIGYRQRWRSVFRKLASTLAGGALGAVHYAHIFDRRPLARVKPADATRPALGKLPHLLVLEGLLDYIDLVRFLFGEIRSVWGSTLKLNPAVKGEDFAVVGLRTTGNQPVNVLLDVNWSSPLPGRASRAAGGPFMRLEGDGGALELDCAAGVLRVRGHNGVPREQMLPAVPDLRLEPHVELQGHFSECLESGRTPECSGREALCSLESTLAIYDADRSGGMVLIEKP